MRTSTPFNGSLCVHATVMWKLPIGGRERGKPIANDMLYQHVGMRITWKRGKSQAWELERSGINVIWSSNWKCHTYFICCLGMHMFRANVWVIQVLVGILGDHALLCQRGHTLPGFSSTTTLFTTLFSIIMAFTWPRVKEALRAAREWAWQERWCESRFSARALMCCVTQTWWCYEDIEY